MSVKLALSHWEEHALRIFRRRVLRNVFGHKTE
jgi:hypothetical protein